MIREIQESDTEAFVRLCTQLDHETPFMLFEPGERSITVEEQRERIGKIAATDNQTIFVVEHDGQLIGYLGAYGGVARRDRHNIYIVIGILQAFTGQGIGTRLFETLEQWARQRGLRRLELDVMTNNQAGVALYTKMGFVIEGIKRESMFVNGAYIDTYFMAKLLT